MRFTEYAANASRLDRHAPMWRELSEECGHFGYVRHVDYFGFVRRIHGNVEPGDGRQHG
jgi:hypothetical protein